MKVSFFFASAGPQVAYLNARRTPMHNTSSSLLNSHTGNAGNLLQGDICKISPSYQRNLAAVFVTLLPNNLGFRGKWQHHYIYFQFFATGL